VEVDSRPKKDPTILTALETAVEPETAGGPTGEQKWVRSSLRRLSARPAESGHAASPPAVGRLLRALDYALHVNAKRRESGAARPERDGQFRHIMQQRRAFEEAGLPRISVDTWTPRRRS
jgi:hypothetical protein